MKAVGARTPASYGVRAESPPPRWEARLGIYHPCGAVRRTQLRFPDNLPVISQLKKGEIDSRTSRDIFRYGH